jgi:vacuolar-type H+-ATPase subunit I/STV1
MQGDFSGAAEIGRMMKADAASAAEEQKKYVEEILTRTSVEQKSFNQSKGQNSQYAKWRKENDQALDKSISKTDKYKAKELEMQQAVLAGTVSQIEADKALAGWKKIILGEEKTKKDPSENYYATPHEMLFHRY